MRPDVLNGGAFLKVKASSQADFEKIYSTYISKYFDDSYLPHNTVLQRSNPNLVMYGQNQDDRIVTGREEGLYLLVQSGSKGGFGGDFISFLKEISLAIEDYQFFVLYDIYIYEYRLDGGIFTYKESEDKDGNFINFYLRKYGDELLSSLLLEECTSNKLMFESLKESGENPFDYFDKDDLKEMYVWLQKIEKGEKKSHIEKWLDEALQGPPQGESSILWKND